MTIAGSADGDDGAESRQPPAYRIRDHRLVKRTRELMAVAQRGDDSQRSAAVVEADSLLAAARAEADPVLLAEALRAASIVRIVTPGQLEAARETLDELLDHARTNDLFIAEADAHALRANRAFRANPEDHLVLDELASALAILEQDNPGSSTLVAAEEAEQTARALSDTAIVLHHLDIHEMAAALLARGQRQLEIADDPHGMVVLLFNRVRSLLLWGLQLERTGQPDAAATQFDVAATVAAEVEEHWRAHLFPDRADRPAADQVVVFAVAFALHRPGGEHLPRLANLRERGVFPDDPVLLDIAHARCLYRAGRRNEAIKVLEKHRHDLDPVDKAEPAIRLSLARELARLGPETVADRNVAWLRYAELLESGLLSLQRARVSALRARTEHAVLRRQHRTLALQAIEDPLTGLPNRRALEERLDGMATGDEQRAAIAMIDLDGFKQINDLHSHEVGDSVLRAVATALRRVLRASDLIARYGGDEFVVLFPATTLPTAVTVLHRAASAVAALPMPLSQHVTVSAGVTTLDAADSLRSALARADRAMYAAKRQGGGRVVAVPAAG
jgi:diguanylate cyclase (GGDEF)-like protein